jgi:cyclophilin family peptidyl-prolyl cis-trans isomerase
MTTARRWLAVIIALAIGCAIDGRAVPLRAQGEVAPLVVIETSQGTVTFVTFPNEAPLTVAHIIALVKRGFYDGQRIHRAIPGFVVQFGDPQTRDEGARSVWGLGTAASSGTPVGVAEITKRRPHLQGAVGLAHMGEPAKGDSQIYITLERRPDLDGQYSVFGQVVDGADVLARLRVGDLITRVFVRE